MALSAFGDEIPDDPTPPGTAARQPQTAPAQPQVSAFGDPLSAFGDALDDEPAKPVQPTADQPWNANDLLPDSLRPIGQAIDDYGLSLSKGMIGAAEGAVGLGDIATGGRVSPSLAHQYGYDPAGRRAELDRMATHEHQQAMQQLDRAQGMAGTLQALRDNPSLIPHAVAESLPSMALGGVAGRGIAAGAKALGAVPGLAGVVGAGAGEGAIAAGQQASSTVQENQRKGVDGLTLGQSGLALASGIGTGLLGAAGARIGRALGVADIDAQLAGANGVDVAKGLVNRALVGTGLESLEELTQSGQQQVLTNLANDRPALEGVTKQMTLGGVVGGAMGGAAGLRRPNMLANQPEQIEQPTPQPAPLTASAQAELVQQVESTVSPTVPKVPFAGSQDVAPLLDNLGVQGEQRAKSLDLLRPAEADIEARRRGVVTMDEQRRLANLIGLDGAQAQAFSRKIGQAWNAEQIMAGTDLVADRLKTVMEQQQRIASGQASDLEKASFVQDLGDLKTVFGELMGARAESGRALAAQRRQVQNMNDAARILEGIGGVQGADDLAAAIGKAVQAGGVQNLAKLVGKPETKMQRLLGYYFRSALLSGVRTHAVNITSNTATLGNEVIERGIAAGIGATKRAFTGGKSGETVFAEPLDLLIGMSRGMSKAGIAAVDAFRTGESAVLGGQAKQDNSLGLNNAPRRPGVLGGVAFAADRAASLPYRALGAEDAWFATLNFEAEMRTLARREALVEKRQGRLPEGVKFSQRIDQIVQNPTPKMIEAAGLHARTNTFNSKAGTFASAVMAAKAKAPWLNLIVPFVRTPANVVKFGLERTPMAPLFKQVREDMMAGGARQERAIARMLWGSGVMVAAGMLAQAGYVTGAGPDDKDERQALINKGWRPYSIKVGDTYHEYSRLDPFAQWLGLASDMATMDYQRKDATDVAVAVLGSLVNNTVNKTYMQGLSNFVEFLQDPKRNAEWYSRQMAGTMAQPFTLLSNIASERDPFAREGNSILDAIKYRMPGLREDLPTKLDGFGEPVPNRAYPGGPFSIAAPIAQSQESSDPVRIEAGRIGWDPTEFQKQLTLNGKKIEIPAEQHHELAQLAGRLTHRGAQRLMKSPAWKSMDDDQKRDALEKMATKARAAVRMAAIPYVTSGKRAALDKLRGQMEAQQ
ncbi:hypothetical protein [Pseudomonas plecoglossicida]|uniref:hypothetical protein n=1 Tax=Pseudomonas plecoglossicida TaxID=70775 RepID=UPI00051D8985|nr:hypothetical protein [Pseudomonas plecoglossicida]KGK24278.1 hypothetical protein GT93_05225 [Pseudomonas plecoglossicida]